MTIVRWPVRWKHRMKPIEIPPLRCREVWPRNPTAVSSNLWLDPGYSEKIGYSVAAMVSFNATRY
jgi:hypothetical protein